MARKELNITRQKLAEVFVDHRTVRQFEKVFELADELTVDVTNETITLAGLALSGAQSAQSTADLADARSKSNGVLVWLSM